MEHSRNRRDRGATPGRLGSVPYWLYGLVLILDVLIVIAVLAALMQLGDRVEDMIWPGGPEWVD